MCVSILLEEITRGVKNKMVLKVIPVLIFQLERGIKVTPENCIIISGAQCSLYGSHNDPLNLCQKVILGKWQSLNRHKQDEDVVLFTQ